MTIEKLLFMKAISESQYALGEDGEGLVFSPQEALEMIEVCLAMKRREESYHKGVLGLSNPDTIAFRKEDILK